MTKTFPEAIQGIRTAIYGREVREDIAQMGEYVQQFAATAEAKATSAASSANAAATSASAAKTSQTAAAGSASAAKTSETNAGSKATAAATSATNAAASATAAADSASTASSKASAAANSASSAASSQAAAKTSENNAASSATAAAGSAKTASDKASAAASSASEAAASQTAAKTSESNAAASASAAKSSADAAAKSAEKAAAANATDTTLTISGTPADAKVTGDALTQRYTKTETDWNFLQHFGTKDSGYNLDADTLDREGLYRYSGAVKNFYGTECYGMVMVLNTTRTEASGADNVWTWQICYTTDREIWWRCRVNKNPWHGWKRVANSTDVNNLQNSIKAVSGTVDNHTTQLATLTAWYQNGVKWADVKEKPSYFNVAYDTAKTVDLSTLDQSKWYPVTGTKLPEDGLHKVKCAVQLNSGTKPDWASHDRGFSVNFEAAVIASGWGVTQAQGIVLVNEAVWIKSGEKSPLGYEQMTNSSTPVFWLRGGGKYHLYDDWGAAWTVRTEAYTASSQTVSPKTEYPGVVMNKSTLRADLDGEASVAAIAKQIGNNGSAGNPITFTWAGKDGMPNWLWGADTSSNTYVYNPRNFDVAKVNGHTITSGTASLTAGSSPLATGTLYLQYK